MRMTCQVANGKMATFVCDVSGQNPHQAGLWTKCVCLGEVSPFSLRLSAQHATQMFRLMMC